MATSNAEYSGYYKPGGVMGGVIGRNKARVVESGHDKYGRWVYFRMNGQGNKIITIIGTYQVCQGNIKTSGPSTALTQQYSMLVQDGYNEPHKVRDHHAKDLISFVKERQQQGELVLIMGDLNEVIEDNNRGFTKLCSECHLIDVVHDKHRYDAREFNTYARGTTCIDYILMDERLIGATQKCGYLPYNQLMISDHRGVYADVDVNWFFGSDIIPNQTMATRDYTTKNIHQTAPFINAQAKHLQEHGWFQQIKQVQQCIVTNTPNHSLTECVDNRRIAACQYSGNRLKTFRPIPYSPDLIRMKTIEKVITMIMRRLRHEEEDDQDMLEDLQDRLQRMGVELQHDMEGYKVLRKKNRQEMVSMIKDEVRTGAVKQSFQDKAIQEALERGDKEKARRIKQIQRAEAISQV
jgi:hypothetical protein